MNHWADYVVCVLFFLISLGIGVYHACSGGKQKTNEEFITANRKLKLLPTSISLVVSYKSALTLIGAPAEIYSYGIMLWPFKSFGAIIGSMVVSWIIIPWLYPLGLTSLYSYFRLRYGTRIVQIYATLIGIITALLYTGTAVYATAIAMETASGLSPRITIPVMTIICMAYTALGGIRAVIWTDVFQALIMFAGQIAILIKATIASGGIGTAFDAVEKEGRIVVDISPDPTVRHTVWSLAIGETLVMMCFLGIQQSSIQRFCAVSPLKEAKRIPALWLVGNLTITALANLIGVALFGYYWKTQCDPLVSGKIRTPNQILALFVTQEFQAQPGFLGLFIATLFSATLSTVSSTLSGAAANTWEDILKPLLPNIKPSRAATVSKVIVLSYGLLSMGLAFTVDYIRGPMIQVTVSVMSICFGPMLGLLLIGGVKRLSWINWKSAMAGSVIRFSLLLWLLLGSITVKDKHPKLPPLSLDQCDPHVNMTTSIVYPTHTGLDRFYSLSYQWYILLGCLTTMLCSAVAAAITGRCQNDKVAADQLPQIVFIPFDQICRKPCRDEEPHDIKLTTNMIQPEREKLTRTHHQIDSTETIRL